MKNLMKGFLVTVVLASGIFTADAQQRGFILQGKALQKDVAYFNSIDTEAVVNFVPNAQAADWLLDNVPLFECPDSVIQTVYNFRWWSFRKHLKQTPDGFVFTEFIIPMKHGGKYNTISSAAGHHIYEGRWLHNQQIIKDYINFWLFVDKKTASPHLHNFSSWLQDAVYHFYLVNKDTAFIRKMIGELNSDYRQWEVEKGLPGGMFYQFDVRDAMEESISGSRKDKNVRPTINSYMYGNAVAMDKMAAILKIDSLQTKYKSKSEFLKAAVQQHLWDDTASFFKVQFPDGRLCESKEELGFIPWYFNLPADTKKYAAQWNSLLDTTGFKAPWGITTAERRAPTFRKHGSGHGCEWDGAVWPFATTQTLKGLSNYLTSYASASKVSARTFFDELKKYAASHQMNGHIYLGEYQDEKTGEWLKGDNPRSTFYNHSGFADLIINDLVGLKPREDKKLELYPLLPAGQWDWFCLDNLNYNGKTFTIVWDKTGKKYGKKKGFTVYSNGQLIYTAPALQHIIIDK